MTKVKRISLNVLATYGRSILSFLITLFTARWVLQALGEDDFGLYGVICSLEYFVCVFNIAQAESVARYYAFAIGHLETRKDQTHGHELQAWFNSAFTVHILLPLVFITLVLPWGQTP